MAMNVLAPMRGRQPQNYLQPASGGAGPTQMAGADPLEGGSSVAEPDLGALADMASESGFDWAAVGGGDPTPEAYEQLLRAASKSDRAATDGGIMLIMEAAKMLGVRSPWDRKFQGPPSGPKGPSGRPRPTAPPPDYVYGRPSK